MLPQCDVIAGRQILTAFDPIIEAANPFKSGQYHPSPYPSQCEPARERQEWTDDGKDDAVAERPKEEERGKNNGSDELHRGGSARQAREIRNSSKQRAQLR